MLRHANYLDKKYGVGPHTVSVPRFKPAAGAKIKEAPYPVSDEDFKLLIAIIRMALPYTGMILSTREPVQLRNKLFKYGISQISAGSVLLQEDIMIRLKNPASSNSMIIGT